MGAYISIGYGVKYTKKGYWNVGRTKWKDEKGFINEWKKFQTRLATKFVNLPDECGMRIAIAVRDQAKSALLGGGKVGKEISKSVSITGNDPSKQDIKRAYKKSIRAVGQPRKQFTGDRTGGTKTISKMAYDTGALFKSIKIKRNKKGSYTISTEDKKAGYHELGTGVFGLRGERIVPKKKFRYYRPGKRGGKIGPDAISSSGKVKKEIRKAPKLRVKLNHPKKTIFADSVRGSPALHYMSRAVSNTRKKVPKIVEDYYIGKKLTIGRLMW